MEQTEKDLIEAFKKETKDLYAIPEAERHEYVKKVIESAIGGIVKLLQKPKLQQPRGAEQLKRELTSKATTLIPALLYTIKGDVMMVKCPKCNEDLSIETANFRDFYVDLYVKITEKQNRKGQN